jgi:hypothetical protein
MRARLAAAVAVVVALCAGCGGTAGLHIEDGGRTVHLRRVAPPKAPPTTHVHVPATPGVHLGAPAAIAYDAGTLWCAVQPGAGLLGSLVTVDTATGRRVATPVPLPPAGRPYLLAVGADGVWLAAGMRLWRIDPTSGKAAVSARLSGPATALLDTAGSIWATVAAPGGGRVVRLDPGSGHRTAEAPVGPSPSALTVAAGSVWVTDSVEQSIERFAIHRRALRSTATIPLPRSSVRAPTQITVFGGFVWVYERGRVLRIGQSSNQVIGTTHVAAVAGGTIAAGSGGIWVITRTRGRGRGAVRLLDAATGLPLGRRIVVGGHPTALVTDGRAAWVLDSAAHRLVRVFPD